LIFARFDEGVLEEAVPEEVKHLWRHVEGKWDDQARHALFLERAWATDSLGYAASRYHRRPEDPLAQEQLGRLNERLEQTLTAMAADPDSRSGLSRRAVITLIILLVAVIGVTYLLLSPTLGR
jgi:hypothetical protein